MHMAYLLIMTSKVAGHAIVANMEHLHLLEKIDAICLAVNATYRVEKGHIIIISANKSVK